VQKETQPAKKKEQKQGAKLAKNPNTSLPNSHNYHRKLRGVDSSIKKSSESDQKLHVFWDPDNDHNCNALSADKPSVYPIALKFGLLVIAGAYLCNGNGTTM